MRCHDGTAVANYPGMARTARGGHPKASNHGLGAVPWLLWVLVGCSASYPDGKIICDDVSECPSGFMCRARAATSGERFCFASAAPQRERPDTGPGPSTSTNTAAVGGDEAGNNEVVPGSDGGPTTSTGGSSGSNMNAGDASMDIDTMDGSVADEGDADQCEEASAECEPGTSETQMLPCGLCNTGTQRATRSCGADCRWGAPKPSGQCTNVTAACEPGDEEPEARDCECGRMQSRTNICSDSCTWVEGAWGECDLADVQCKPGETQMQTVACDSCGTRVQQRSCAANSCTWGDWSDISTACASSCYDCSEVQFCEAPANQPNPGGTKCRQTSGACTREQTLADCQADMPVVCGTVHQPFHIEYL